MDRIDFTNIGGFPFSATRADFMQQSYLNGFAAVASMIGNKVIVSGCNVVGGVVGDGWITYNGELIPFIGGNVSAGVVIQEIPTSFAFQDDTNKNICFSKKATCGAPATFNFNELKPLSTLINIWNPGDIKEKYCDNAYITANFDANGYGLNAEVGWRIMSKAYPDSAGKIFVNRDTNDPDFYVAGQTGGEKKHTLIGTEQGSIKFKKHNDQFATNSDGSNGTQTIVVNGITIPNQADTNGEAGAFGTEVTIRLNDDSTGHNNLQPYFVVLKLIKL